MAFQLIIGLELVGGRKNLLEHAERIFIDFATWNVTSNYTYGWLWFTALLMNGSNSIMIVLTIYIFII